ncbi:10466_t:CDS:2, partial [Cetraspora pellucida]
PEIGNKFQIVESFKKAAQQGAKAVGFAFSISSSKMSHDEKGGQAPYIILQYTIGSVYINNHNITEETRKRIKFTKHQGCLVALYAVLDEKADVWILNTEQKKLVHMMLKSEAPIQIRNALNKGSNNDTTMQLLQMLEECQYVVRHLLSKDGCMKNLFFTYIEAARHAAICPEVLIIDATYKTNLYKLPLINSVENEKEYTYEWFLNTLKETVYNAFFCSSEVFVSDKSKALQNVANKFFDSDDDNEKLLLSIQKVAYAEKMSIVKEAFEEVKQAVMKSRDPNYIQNYFEEWKKDSEYWMHVYTKHYPHIGVFSYIDRVFRQHQLQKNEALGPISLSIIHPLWLLKHNSVPLLPSSLSTDTAFNKALYMLKEKYTNLNDSRSKASLLHKIKALIAEEIVIPKAP